jgi:hypothetical protein
VRLGLAALLLLAAPLPAASATVFEVYDQLPLFVARLGGAAAIRTVDFDDIATSGGNVVAFDADRYEAATGAVIRSLTDEGQYVSRTFGFPSDFQPVSAPNAYAPGPVAIVTGTNTTTLVTFTTGGAPGVVSGFGCFFIDADFPGIGPSSFSVFDREDGLLTGTGVVSGADGSQLFRGIVAVDDVGDVPVPVIASVRIVSGNEWPSVDVGEGVVLDDFTFSAVPEPAGGLLLAAGSLALQATRRRRRGGAAG